MGFFNAKEDGVTTEKTGRTYWKEQCVIWAASGLSRKEFALRHGLNRATFTWWCTHLRHDLAAEQAITRPAKSSGFVEVVAAQPPRPVQPTPSAPSVTVRLGELVIDFAGALPPTWWVVELAERC
jgi:hypothetical protein